MQSMLLNALLIEEYTYLSGYFTANPQRALCALCRKHTPTPKEQAHCEDTTLMYSWCQSAQNRTSSVFPSHGKGSKLTEVMLCECVLAIASGRNNGIRSPSCICEGIKQEPQSLRGESTGLLYCRPIFFFVLYLYRFVVFSFIS